MTSSESSSEGEIIGKGQILSDHVFTSWFKSIVYIVCLLSDVKNQPNIYDFLFSLKNIKMGEQLLLFYNFDF